MISTLKITNSSKKSIKLILEPWAEEYDVLAGVTVDVSVTASSESSIEVEYEIDSIIVYGWGEKINVFSNGEKIEPSFD